MENGKNPEDQYTLLRSDRRRNLRRQILVLKVKGEDQKGTFFGYCKTVSRGGMFITSVNPRKLGEEFDITFSLTGEDLEIKCRCAVVWVREYDAYNKQEPGMGIKFINLSDEIKDRIDAWMEKSK
ncbi:MAG: PilZ domain-containing protein [Deltaproteobacteria bacterium]